MKRCIASFLLVAASVAALAQPSPFTAIPQSLVFTVGTTARDTGGADWAFLLWESPGADLLGGRSFAVYAKTGDVNSPATYAREAVVSGGRLDPALIAPLLRRAELLGQDLAAFDRVILGMHAGCHYPNEAPPLSPDRVMRTVNVLSKAHTVPNIISSMRTLAMVNPTLALCLGTAWVGPMPAAVTRTYELREWNGADGAVVGRVTLTAGLPVVLPAPAPPVQVPDASESADLSVRLRWGVPDVLKRRVMLHQGYRVWRMSWAQAQALGYDANAPTVEQLQAHVGTGAARLITEAPVFVNKPMSPLDAANLTFEPTRSYLADDNGLLSDPEHYVMPADGAEYAYFVTARDLLGRPGLPSLAGRGVFGKTRRPDVPREAKVEIAYGTPDANGVRPQHFRFTFLENAADAASPTTHYEIYRGTGEVKDANGLPAPGNLATPPLAHNGSGRRQYDAMPPFPFSIGEQVWFCVRAVRVSALGTFVSDLTPPVYAALQNHAPPAAPTSDGLGSLCPQPGVVLGSKGVVAGETVTPNRLHHFRMTCDRLDEQILWAEFGWLDENNAEFVLDRIEFAGEERVQMDFPLMDNEVGRETVFFCRVDDKDGSLEMPTTYAARPAGPLAPDAVYALNFLAAVLSPTSLDMAHPVSAYFHENEEVFPLVSLSHDAASGLLIGGNDDINFSLGFTVERNFTPGGWRSVGFGSQFTTQAGQRLIQFRDSTPAGPSTIASEYRVTGLNHLRHCRGARPIAVAAASKTGAATKVRVCLTHDASPELLEYRIFRRVGDGDLSLVDEGRVLTGPGTNPICIEDGGLPATGGSVIYYGQLVGNNGAGSALARLAEVDARPVELPRPVLSAPRAAGTAADTKVRLTWACPVESVDRFEIALIPQDNAAPAATNTGFQVSRNRMANSASQRSLVGLVNLAQFVPQSALITSILTDRVGSTALGSGPSFTVDLDVVPDTKYRISVQARDRSGGIGKPSVVHEFTWKTPPTLVDENVPWPARSLPSLLDVSGNVKCMPALLPDEGNHDGLVWPYGLGTQVGFQIGTISTLNGNEVEFQSSGGVRLVPADGQDRDFNAYLSRPIPRLAPRVLPAVLYRQQLPNLEWPDVSGDVVQVSPLVSRIIWSAPPSAPASESQSFMRDPFVGVELDSDGNEARLYLLDTTPRAIGAKYRYWLVMFDATTGAPWCVKPATLEEVTP